MTAATPRRRPKPPAQPVLDETAVAVELALLRQSFDHLADQYEALLPLIQRLQEQLADQAELKRRMKAVEERMAAEEQRGAAHDQTITRWRIIGGLVWPLVTGAAALIASRMDSILAWLAGVKP
jgi:hypothetical protein